MAAVAAVSSVAVVSVPACRLGEKSTLSSSSLSLAPARSHKLVANRSRIVMSAEKEQNLAIPTTLALIASAVLPELAEAAQPGVSPSLKNLLLSVAAGGTVLAGIAIAVAGVSVFDPVKRK